MVLRGPTTGQAMTEAGPQRIFRTHRARSGATSHPPAPSTPPNVNPAGTDDVALEATTITSRSSGGSNQPAGNDG
jgi:hypothetical protein